MSSLVRGRTQLRSSAVFCFAERRYIVYSSESSFSRAASPHHQTSRHFYQPNFNGLRLYVFLNLLVFPRCLSARRSIVITWEKRVYRAREARQLTACWSG